MLNFLFSSHLVDFLHTLITKVKHRQMILLKCTSGLHQHAKRHTQMIGLRYDNLAYYTIEPVIYQGNVWWIQKHGLIFEFRQRVPRSTKRCLPKFDEYMQNDGAFNKYVAELKKMT